MASSQAAVRLTRWSGGQNPTLSSITRLMQKEGLRPYMWENTPNYRYAVRSHGYSKVLYVVEGSVEISFPDSKQSVRLKSGDRLEIPNGVHHSVIIGSSGAKCVEAAIASS
jgi:mannose-6-phosphate isomerase-like protein (cupin superfamily)